MIASAAPSSTIPAKTTCQNQRAVRSLAVEIVSGGKEDLDLAPVEALFAFAYGDWNGKLFLSTMLRPRACSWHHVERVPLSGGAAVSSKFKNRSQLGGPCTRRPAH